MSVDEIPLCYLNEAPFIPFKCTHFMPLKLSAFHTFSVKGYNGKNKFTYELYFYRNYDCIIILMGIYKYSKNKPLHRSHQL